MWYVIGGLFLCVVMTLLAIGLRIQWAKRRLAEVDLRTSVKVQRQLIGHLGQVLHQGQDGLLQLPALQLGNVVRVVQLGTELHGTEVGEQSGKM